MRLLATSSLSAVIMTLCCGPCTLCSMIRPLEYDVATELTFTEAGTTTTQVVVTHCKLIDQRDSIIKTVSVTVTGDRHSYLTQSGGVLVFGPIKPCRYRPREKLPPVGHTVPLVTRDSRRRAEAVDPVDEEEEVQILYPSQSWLFDDPTNPTRMDVLDTYALLDGELDIGVTATLGRTDQPLTRTLDADFPWLRRVQAEEAAQRAQRERAPRGASGTIKPPPNRFEGVMATAFALRNGASCEVADSAGPTQVERGDDCQYLQECRPGRPQACREPLGGLNPSFDDDFEVVRFTVDTPRPGYQGTLLRAVTVPPSAPRIHHRWRPDACVDALCIDAEDFEYGGWIVYPDPGILVHLDPRPEQVSRSTLVAGPAGRAARP